MGVNSIIRYHKALTAVSNTTIATFEGFWGHLVPLQTCIFSSKALASCSLTLHPLHWHVRSVLLLLWEQLAEAELLLCCAVAASSNRPAVRAARVVFRMDVGPRGKGWPHPVFKWHFWCYRSATFTTAGISSAYVLDLGYATVIRIVLLQGAHGTRCWYCNDCCRVCKTWPRIYLFRSK